LKYIKETQLHYRFAFAPAIVEDDNSKIKIKGEDNYVKRK